MKLLLSVLFFAVVAQAAPKLKPLSEFFEACHRNDPQMGACLKRSIENSRQKLIKGIPELDLPTIEPLFIKKIEMKQGSGNFRMELLLTDLTISGASQYVVQDASIDMDKLTMKLTVFVKSMDFVGNYKSDMQILVLPVKGEGKVTFNFREITLIGNSVLEIYKKGGKDYFRIKDLHLSINPKSIKSTFSNLFNGDKKLGDTTNAFLNNNALEVYETYRQLPEQAFGSWMKSTCDQVFSKYSVDQLLPP